MTTDKNYFLKICFFLNMSKHSEQKGFFVLQFQRYNLLFNQKSVVHAVSIPTEEDKKQTETEAYKNVREQNGKKIAEKDRNRQKPTKTDRKRNRQKLAETDSNGQNGQEQTGGEKEEYHQKNCVQSHDNT